MNYYFFLATPQFDCEIGLANFAPNETTRRKLREQYICSARPIDGTWVTDTHGTIQPGNLSTVRPIDLGLSNEEAASCLVFMSPDPVKGIINSLPRPTDFESTPAWRANLRIVGESTSVSYQGEYPAGMFDIPRPRLVSICAMLQPGMINALLLASFNGSASAREGSIRISRLKTGELLTEAVVAWNRVNHIDLSTSQLSDVPELVLLSSENIAGIPIFFTRDSEARHFSLEHTHPPAELTVFGRPSSRTRVIQKMRSAWLGFKYDA